MGVDRVASPVVRKERMEKQIGNRIFAIGDIHGCDDRFARLLERLPFDPGRDTLVFLGDYIDRGPGSRHVVERICGLIEAGVHVVPLIGNHEYLMLEYHRTGDPVLPHYLNRIGIQATLESYGAANLHAVRDLGFLPATHRRFFDSLLPYWETGDFVFVHAGIVPGLPLALHDLPTLCETRNFLATPYQGPKTVVFGHTPLETPLVADCRIGIDTGAVYGNLLTAVELPARIFYHT